MNPHPTTPIKKIPVATNPAITTGWRKSILWDCVVELMFSFELSEKQEEYQREEHSDDQRSDDELDLDVVSSEARNRRSEATTSLDNENQLPLSAVDIRCS